MTARCSYTPGPWVLVETSNEEETAYITGVHQKEPVAVACVCGELPHDEDNANARLIAAAPDLVEACRVLVAQLEAFRAAAIDARIWDRDDGDAIEVGRAALRRAGVEP